MMKSPSRYRLSARSSPRSGAAAKKDSTVAIQAGPGVLQLKWRAREGVSAFLLLRSFHPQRFCNASSIFRRPERTPFRRGDTLSARNSPAPPATK